MKRYTLYEDYKRSFKKEPDQVYAIGLRTDTDNTGSGAVAQYGKIVRKMPPQL
jgi:hypothetical protein